MKITLESSFKVYLDLIISPEELIELYFFGITIRANGRDLLEDLNVIVTYIRSAQEELEKYLNLKFSKQVLVENRNFYLDDTLKWNYVRTSFPVVYPIKLQGKIGNQIQVDFPTEWLSYKKSSDPLGYYRIINIVPGEGGSAYTSSVVYGGSMFSYLGLRRSKEIPNYWEASYITGFEEVPYDILNFVGKLAAINVFHIAGDLILGAGIASQSIGIDGLSQSISTTSSATNAGYGARIIGYLDDLKRSLPIIENTYRGISMITM